MHIKLCSNPQKYINHIQKCAGLILCKRLKKMEHKTWENVLSEFNGARKEKPNPFYSMRDFSEEQEHAADAGEKKKFYPALKLMQEKRWRGTLRTFDFRWLKKKDTLYHMILTYLTQTDWGSLWLSRPRIHFIPCIRLLYQLGCHRASALETSADRVG